MAIFYGRLPAARPRFYGSRPAARVLEAHGAAMANLLRAAQGPPPEPIPPRPAWWRRRARRYWRLQRHIASLERELGL